MAGSIFISYSRKQLYFAEAITLHLQRDGFEVWFDLQQLAAGEDWSEDLQDGLQDCDRLILLASQASLKSEYVRQEWQSALQAGKEIIVVALEEVSLPQELAGASCLDFRRKFTSKRRQLVRYLQGGEPPADVIPEPHGTFSWVIPNGIWLVLIGIALPGLSLLLMPFVAPQMIDSSSISGLTVYLLLLVASLWGCMGAGKRLLQHALAYSTLRRIGIVLLIFQFIFSFGYIGAVEGEQITALGWLGLLAALFTGFIYFFHYNLSSALLRWYAAGEVPQSYRRRVHKRLLNAGSGNRLQEIGSVIADLDYYLYVDKADQPMAEKIHAALAQTGSRQQDDPTSAEAIFALLTNRSSQRSIDQLLGEHGGKITFIVGSSLRFTDVVQEAGRYQWVDFREMDNRDIRLMARSKANNPVWQREVALETTPQDLEGYAAPLGLSVFRFLGQWQSATMMAVGLALLLGGEKIAWSLLYLLSGIGLYIAVERSLRRRVTARVAFLLFLEALVVGAAFKFSVVAIIQFIFLLLAWGSARAWFPAPTPQHADAVGLNLQTNFIRSVRIQTAAIFIVVFVIAMLPQFRI